MENDPIIQYMIDNKLTVSIVWNNFGRLETVSGAKIPLQSQDFIAFIHPHNGLTYTIPKNHLEQIRTPTP